VVVTWHGHTLAKYQLGTESDSPVERRRWLSEAPDNGAKRQERDAAMAITIEFVNAEIPEQEITLTGLPVVIGRSPQADVQLEDSCVSRQHCEIDEMNGRPIVRDLDSKNGTFINGAAVQQTVVKPEDRITVGRIRLRARCNAERTEMAADGEDQRGNPSGY
jgi:pSer/pThr/pTyr-binding forkhead associated (FHA) protein